MTLATQSRVKIPSWVFFLEMCSPFIEIFMGFVLFSSFFFLTIALLNVKIFKKYVIFGPDVVNNSR